MHAQPISGFVLAGGKSTRMGKDKAVLSLHGRTLLQTALAALRAVASEVAVVGSPKLHSGYAPVITDVFDGCGPLGGIHAALSHTKTEFNIILAVDTPFISAKLLAFLAERALASRSVVTAPEINAYPQPLCAVYSRAFLPVAEQALQAGRYKIVPLFRDTTTVYIRQSELEQFAFGPEMFENLNTPEDLEHASQRPPGSNA